MILHTYNNNNMFFYSPTYFVEYQFPAIVHQPSAGVRRRKLPGSHEIMRIASKRMKDGGVYRSCIEIMLFRTVAIRFGNVSILTYN